MRTIIYILQKEFIRIFRNKTLLPLIFVLPIVQLVILVNAATMEMKEIKMAVVDMDKTETSRKLVSKYKASPFYVIAASYNSDKEAGNTLKSGEANVVMYIPQNFEKGLKRDSKASVQFQINAINGSVAGLINAYSSGILRDFNKEVLAEWFDLNRMKLEMPIEVNTSFWYNPTLKYTIYMLPGILVILVTLIGMFLTALNIVREKEMGTIEQINVTPIRKHHFIIGKLVPFLIIAMFELAFGLLIGLLLFDQPIEGSLFTLFLLAFVYLIVALGLGLLLSAISETQQQVMFIVFFFLLIFILMSGIFTPSESMPVWAQKVNIINPFSYFMRGIRMILLKGSGLSDVKNEIYALAIYGGVALSFATWRYRKTT